MWRPFYLLWVGEDVNSNDVGGVVVIGSTGSTGEVVNSLGEISSVTATIKIQKYEQVTKSVINI